MHTINIWHFLQMAHCYCYCYFCRNCLNQSEWEIKNNTTRNPKFIYHINKCANKSKTYVSLAYNIWYSLHIVLKYFIGGPFLRKWFHYTLAIPSQPNLFDFCKHILIIYDAYKWDSIRFVVVVVVATAEYWHKKMYTRFELFARIPSVNCEIVE